MRRFPLLIVLTLSAGTIVLAGRLPGDPAASDDVGDFLKPAQSAAAGEGNDIGRTVGGIASAMGDIAADLGRQKTDAPLQTKQKHVADSLDVMIQALEKACNGSGGGMNPTQGLKKSTLAGGPGGMGDLRDVRAGEKQWGALKPKAREQILQAQTDGFPSGYESLLQSYYRRLSSEENAPAAADTAGGPTTRPGAGRP